MLQDHKADSYMAGLMESISISWPMLVIIITLSAALAWFVFRWQMKYSRSNTSLWCTTVFLTTVPGLFAYWLMHRGTVLEPCSGCGQQVPRDRDACARCEKSFPEPNLLGTEVFAENRFLLVTR